MKLDHYSKLADLFVYPDENYPKQVAAVLSMLKEKYPFASSEADLFYNQLPVNDVNALRELYTRSFDVQAITTLDVGYVLFGDDYKRGEILSNLNREHIEAENDCGFELADHLPNLLRLIPKLKDEELIQELVHSILAPALKEMVKEFDPKRQVEKDKLYKKHYKTLIETREATRGLYGYALKALYSVVKQDFDIKEEDLNQYLANDFLKLIGTEMSVEKLAAE